MDPFCEKHVIFRHNQLDGKDLPGHPPFIAAIFIQEAEKTLEMDMSYKGYLYSKL